MAEVRALQDVGQFTESIDELREILAVQPAFPEALYRLGVALVQTGEPSRAIWVLQEASQSPEYAIPAGLVLGSAHLTTENFEEAVRAADRVLEIDPERQVALQMRARANIGARRVEDALKDCERLVELYPDDYTVRVLYATVLAETGNLEAAEEAHDLLKEMGASSGDPAIMGRSCLAPAVFAKDDLKDNDRAEKLFAECARDYPTETVVLRSAVQFFDDAGKPERATDLLRSAVEQAPENLGLRSSLANRLRFRGQADEAEAVLLEAVDTFGTAAAWNALATFYRRQNRADKALEAIDRVVELSPGTSDQLRFTRADLLVDVGKLDEAEREARELKQPTYATLIRGRILLERGDAAGALEAFEKGVRNWPNNPGARYLAGRAALELGDFDRAASELREAVRADSAATDAAHLLARLYYDRGEYRQAVGFIRSSIGRSRGSPKPEDLVLGARCYVALADYDNARKALKTLSAIPGQQATAVFEEAALERAASGTPAAVAVIESSGLDLGKPENEQPLRALAEYLVDLGRADEALRRVDAALARDPERAPLQHVRGFALGRSGRTEEARAAFAKAAQLDPEYAPALASLATLAANEGDRAAAIELFDRAAELDPSKPSYLYSASQLSQLAGDREGAETRLREVIRRAPGHAASRNDLAWLLAEENRDLDTALELALEARRLDPSGDVLDTLGWVQLQRGDAAAAVVALEQAVEALPESPSLRYRLGLALSQAGEQERAREVLENALEGGSFPEAEAARRELAQLRQP
ncbi:MAG: tetratricopeptide repeat protein [Myxococcota bacterium]